MRNRILFSFLAWVAVIVSVQGKQKDFVLQSGRPVAIACSGSEAPVVRTSLDLLSRDLQTVLSATAHVDTNTGNIIVGTIGQSKLIEQAGIDISALKNKKQAFLLTVSEDGKLVVAGSDSHGTAYGILEISRLLGVSPWEWWADVTPEKKETFRLSGKFRELQSPSVEYRGIFINDEDWGLMPWSNKTYEPSDVKGEIGPRTNERIFELLLRLRANTYWPAMHECTLPFFLTISSLPLMTVIFLLIIKYSKQSFYTLFILQFLLAAAYAVSDIPLGVATLMCTLFAVVLLFAYGMHEKIDWSESRNGMLMLFLIWGVYCILEIANPNNVQAAWNISITHYLIYPIVCAVIVPLAIRNIKGIQWLLIIWSLFILLAAAKGYWQKNCGFNEREQYFLYVLGGARTHIIWSGIRYFSFFSDAANFGVHMAMGVSLFGISLFYIKGVWLKIYFIIVIIAAIYGMGISGTRAAIALPIGALGSFIILSRNRKACITGISVLALLFLFFVCTNIGDDNQYIRKMRSAFRPSQDASYQLRVDNRKKMRELMIHKPFGYGIGLSKGDRFYPKERMPYPPDSWLVSVWVETGIIGLVLYLAVHGVLFAWCGWILMFKIMNKRLRGLLTAWLCTAAGFYLAAYANDVMQYPNSIPIYTAFALCFAGPYIDKRMQQSKETELKNEQ